MGFISEIIHYVRHVKLFRFFEFRIQWLNESLENFVVTLEHFFTIYDMKDKSKFYIPFKLFWPKQFSTVRNLLVANKPGNTSYEEICKA